MKALKTFDIKELSERQKLLDERFDGKKTVRKRTVNRVKLAYFCELGELAQELKAEWNYWKNSTKKADKRRVMEELSDCLHFYLSYFNNDYNVDDDFCDYLSHRILDDDRYDDIEEALEMMTKIEFPEKVFGAMKYIAKKTGGTEQEFLKVHHEVWLRNMGERTREEY